MVQDILPAILPAVVADLREWTVSLRLNAARCLQSVLLLAGAAVSPHLPHLLGPLCTAAGDDEEQVAHYVVQAAQVCLFGTFFCTDRNCSCDAAGFSTFAAIVNLIDILIVSEVYTLLVPASACVKAHISEQFQTAAGCCRILEQQCL